MLLSFQIDSVSFVVPAWVLWTAWLWLAVYCFMSYMKLFLSFRSLMHARRVRREQSRGGHRCR